MILLLKMVEPWGCQTTEEKKCWVEIFTIILFGRFLLEILIHQKWKIMSQIKNAIL